MKDKEIEDKLKIFTKYGCTPEYECRFRGCKICDIDPLRKLAWKKLKEMAE